MVKEIKALEAYCDECGLPFLSEFEETLMSRDKADLYAWIDHSDWERDENKITCLDCQIKAANEEADKEQANATQHN